MWKYYALLSALFAALVTILAKVGMKGVDSNLAVAIRTVVIVITAWLIAWTSGGLSGIFSMTVKNWVFLLLSGFATAFAWLFYFKALQTGDASKVAPLDKMSVPIAILLGILILGEPADPKVIIGGILIVSGALVILW